MKHIVTTALILLGLTSVAQAGGTVITGPTGLTNNSVTDAKLRDSAGLSVIGRSADTTGDPADIIAGADGDVLRRSGTSLGFGAIPIASVTGGQARVTGTCTTPNAIVSINSDGTVSCSTGVLNTSNVSGTANYTAKFTSTNTVGNGWAQDNGTTWGVSGAFTITEASGNTLVSGTLGATGDFAVNTNKFNVTASSGNTTVAGTLGVTGDLAVNTNKFNVTASSGNTTVAGTLGVTGNFAINTNKFNVTASSGDTTIAGTLSLTPMTSGSVLFAGSSGTVTQDNTAFNWNNTNKTLTVQSSASYALNVVATSTNDPLRIQNTNAAGASTMYMTDSAGTIKVSFGYANSSFAGGVLTSRAFVWRNGPDFVFQNQSGAIDAMLFSGGNWNFGSTATDPGVKVRVQGALTATGNATLGTDASNRHTLNGGTDIIDALGTTFGSLDSLTTSPLAVWDSTAQATGVGGGILFLGKYTNGGGYAGAAGIKMMKENSTDNNYSFALAFGTRANGGSLTEYFRISSTGSSNFVGDLSVATNKFTVTASSGNTLVAGTLTISPLTAGSVPFAGTAGLISQSNADFFWDNTNKRLGIGTASPTNPMTVSSTGTSDMVSIKNTDATLWSTYVARDNGGTVRIAFGYGNASTADTPRNSRGHIWLENGTDFVFMKGGAIPGTALMYITNSNGNTNIGSTLGDPGSKLRVQGRVDVQHTTSAEPAVIIRNSSSSGYSATDLYDSSNTFKGAYGYGNGSVGVTHLQSQLYFYSGGPDWSFANGTRREVTVGMTTGSTFLQMQNGSSAAVSDASTGRIRYNTTGQKFQASLNNAAYVDLVVSSSAGVGTTNALPKWTAANTLGNSSVSDDATTFAINTNKFTVTESSGNTLVAGTLDSTGDFKVNTNKFTVTASSGNTLVAGTLSVNGNATVGDANGDLATVFGHVLYDGTAPSKDAGCDGSGAATVTGTDAAFHSTTGTGATACTWTFSRTYTVAPTCTAFAEAGAALPTCTISATAITCTVVAASTTYHWMCATSNGGA